MRAYYCTAYTLYMRMHVHIAVQVAICISRIPRSRPVHRRGRRVSRHSCAAVRTCALYLSSMSATGALGAIVLALLVGLGQFGLHKIPEGAIIPLRTSKEFCCIRHGSVAGSAKTSFVR